MSGSSTPLYGLAASSSPPTASHPDDQSAILLARASWRTLVSAYFAAFVCGARRNSLEALVWEKEAEVDRFRDRWPMSLLVSRVRMFNQIEENKPRDVLAALNQGKGKGGVAILGEVREKERPSVA